MTQVHSLQLKEMHSEVSPTNTNTRESGNDPLLRSIAYILNTKPVTQYFLINTFLLLTEEGPGN